MTKAAVRRYAVITGTGRAGTSLLVQLLTYLGLDTGFSTENLRLFPEARAGLEHDFRPGELPGPYIVKSPRFYAYAQEVLKREDLSIDHVFIPVRDLSAAAESRRAVQRNRIGKLGAFRRLLLKVRPLKPGAIPGGLTGSARPAEQERVLQGRFFELAWVLADSHVPVTLLRYPRLAKDGPYLFEKLRPILGGIEEPIFQEAFEKTVRPDWMHRFSERDA